MQNLIKILLIEDDDVIQRFLTLALKTNGYDVCQAKDGSIALAQLSNMTFDLILLDLGLPDMDGMDVLFQIRSLSQTPVIIISARGRESDKVNALDQGANDYITKPFNMGEVLARIRVALRNHDTPMTQVFDYRGLTVDFERYLVHVDGDEIHLTPLEFKMLTLLIHYQGKVLTHSFIQDKVWGYQTTDDYQTLRVFMASIRKKIQRKTQHESLIMTEIGVGYRFRDD
jgi:two-component system KDP operon response regulator KdpE